LRRPNLLVLSALAGALLLATPAFAGLSPSEKALLQVMNETRAAHRLQPLKIDSRLEQAARSHTQDMLRRGYFDHGPFFERMERFGVQGRVIGENIAWAPSRYSSVARVVVRMWLRSPEHRANLLRPGFRRVGVAALPGRFGGNKVRMVTADFAGR
jgi:uncharacterized protein YkwD